MSDLDQISQGGTVTKEAVSGDSIVLFTSDIANTALKERGLEIGETYDMWSNTGIPKKVGEYKIEGLSGGPLLIEGENTSWVEKNIVSSGKNISVWGSDETGKITCIGYINSFQADSRGGSLITINGIEYYFDKEEEVGRNSDVAGSVSSIIQR